MLAPPGDLLQRPTEEAARLVALSFLEEARLALQRVGDESQPDALHDFRVAVRRIRTTLRAWRPHLGDAVSKKHRRALRELQAATGGSRDAEVALAWLAGQRPELSTRHRRGHDWIAGELEQRRRRSFPRVRDKVGRKFTRIHAALRRRLEVLRFERHLLDAEPTPPEPFAAALARRARRDARKLARGLGAVESAEDRARCHRARIACKRLRYLLEPARPLVPEARPVVKECKRLQDVLGELNDAHVLRNELRSALESAPPEQARRLGDLAREGDDAALRPEARSNERPGLVELLRRAQARIDRLFGELDARWLSDGAEQLVSCVEQLAAALDRSQREEWEFERKYLLRALPPLPPDAEELEIDQGWLPGERLRERVRRQSLHGVSTYYRTIKLGSGVRRFELEEATPAEVFEPLWRLTKDCRVRKRRYRLREGDLCWEIDEFLDRELFLAEVELSDAETRPEIPAWLAPYVVREVTDDARYTNLQLARSGERAPEEPPAGAPEEPPAG